MKLTKAENRDKAEHKRKNGMRVDGRSVFHIQNSIVKRAKKTKTKKVKKGN